MKKLKLSIGTTLLLSGILLSGISYAYDGSFGDNLVWGMAGDARVQGLQQFLTDQEVYSGPITGNFYLLTYEGVRRFQIKEGISPHSGYFGPLTRAKANLIITAQTHTDESTPTTTDVSLSATDSSANNVSQADASAGIADWLQARVIATADSIKRMWNSRKHRTTDTTQPTVSLSSSSAPVTNTSIPVAISFSESVNNFTVSDVAVTNGTAKNFSGKGSAYSVTVAPVSDGTVSVDVPSGVATDAAGNANAPAPTLTRVYDRTPPVVTGLLDFATPSPSATWTWESESGATFRYVIDTNSSGSPSGGFLLVTSASKTSGTGTYYIHVQAKDTAGNRSAVATAYAVLGNVSVIVPPPEPPVIPPPPPPTPPPQNSNESYINAYTTAYTYWDNTPPGSADISNPIIHQKAGGTGTYADPITLAVGHSIINGNDILDYPAGTIFYIPNVRRYFIVEDTCGDGRTPQNGPCHTGYPNGTTTWVDMWIDGQSGTSSSANACAEAVTDANGEVHVIIENPASHYAVVPGPVFQNGSCTKQYGNTPVIQ